MAARERLGGLAEAARAGVFVLAAAFDVVLVETVGVGQTEAEVAGLVDTLVFVAQPGAGDLLQFMKAGVLELPDVFAVNKADLGAIAERTARELDAGLGLVERDRGLARRCGARLGARRPRRRRARRALAATAPGSRRELAERRRRGRDAACAGRSAATARGRQAAGGLAAIDERLRREPDASGFALAARLAEEIEAALRR